MRKVLVTGSREMSAAMEKAVIAIVTKIAKDGDCLIVGDAPGVDATAIRTADRLGCQVVVYGANKLRNSTKTGTNHIVTCTYSARDKLMADDCNVCVAVWNGESKGTRETFQYTLSLGKPVTVWNRGVIMRMLSK